MKRRDFVKGASLFTAMSVLPKMQTWAMGNGPNKTALVLGGTKFVGPEIVKKLVVKGYTVTLFNRGKTNPHLFPHLEKLKGDRYPDKSTGLKALEGNRTWDVVIDTWAESPLCVRDTVELLKSRCKQYLYISTIAVYTDKLLDSRAGMTEEQPLPNDSLPQSYMAKLGYGTNKRIADRIVASLPHGCVLRPHSICGFHMDTTSDNQRYWPVRLQRGGMIAAPGDGADPTQYIDNRDLAGFVMRSISEGYTGVFNTFTSERFDAYLYGLKALSRRQSELVWVPSKFLLDNGFKGWTDMAMWHDRKIAKGFFTISNQKALDHGLEIRPLADTFKNVVLGFNTIESPDYTFGTGDSWSGLSPAKEKDLLKKYLSS